MENWGRWWYNGLPEEPLVLLKNFLVLIQSQKLFFHPWKQFFSLFYIRTIRDRVLNSLGDIFLSFFFNLIQSGTLCLEALITAEQLAFRFGPWILLCMQNCLKYIFVLKLCLLQYAFLSLLLPFTSGFILSAFCTE